MRSALFIAIVAAVTASHDITSEAEFDSLTAGSDRVTIVEFTAPWCEACGKFSPLLANAVADIRDRHAPNLQALHVDGDSQVALRSRFKVLEAPGILLLAAGRSDPEGAVRYDGALNQPAVVEWAAKELDKISRWEKLDRAGINPETVTPPPSKPPPPPPPPPKPPPWFCAVQRRGLAAAPRRRAARVVRH